MSIKLSSPYLSAEGIEQSSAWNQQIGQFKLPISERRVLLKTGDFFAFFVMSWATPLLLSFIGPSVGETNFNLNNPQENILIYSLALYLTWYLAAFALNLYDILSSYSKTRTLNRLATTFSVLVVVVIAASLVPQIGIRRLVGLTFVTGAIGLVAAWRLFYIFLSAMMPWHHNIVVIGNGPKAASVSDLLGKTKKLHYRVLGYLNEDTISPTVQNLGDGNQSDSDILGSWSDLPQLTQEHQIHEILLAYEGQLNPALFELLIECQARGIQVSWLANLFEQVHRRTPVDHTDPVWALTALQGKPVFSRGQLVLKRLLDLIIVSLLFVPFLFLVPLVAIAIKLDSAGPVLYSQIRAGRGGRPFRIYKFRTMRTDAEVAGKAVWAQKEDPRITRIGRFLRKSRLDELPQLWNVLWGEMSFIGPRPERPEFIASLSESIPYFAIRTMTKPGLTGWAQINYDYGNTIEDAKMKLQYDFYYLRHWSLGMDLYILARTIGVILKLKGL